MAALVRGSLCILALEESRTPSLFNNQSSNPIYWNFPAFSLLFTCEARFSNSRGPASL
jgi:hypothetical protein